MRLALPTPRASVIRKTKKKKSDDTSAMVGISALRLFQVFFVGVITLPVFVDGNLHPLSPADYVLRSLNDCCVANTDCEVKLNNATSVHSAVIVTASQFRVRQGAREGGCKITIEAADYDNLIVAVVEANLRQGLMNDSCIDYYKIVTRFETDLAVRARCERLGPSDLNHQATSNRLDIILYAKTPLSHFFDGSTLAVVVTSTADPVDGVCGPNQFLCAKSTRCIYGGYKCDNVNNCGDNADEEKLGASTCLMPKISLLLISFGIINFIVTWLSVIYCCVKSAISKKKAMREDRWGMATPPLMSGATGDGNTPADVSVFGNGSPDEGDTMGPLQNEDGFKEEAVRTYIPGGAANAGDADANDDSTTAN